MIIGVAYYPEHWSRERWETDCRLMREMGINAVRIGEFGWSVMEKEEEKFDFTLYDEAIALLGKYGISVILGTPTAAPPAWLCQKYPDIYMKDRMGIQRGFGSRRHYCYNHKGYRTASAEIVSAMAEHYKDNPNIIAWQIDNELGCEDEVRCYCEDCRTEFIRWLKKRYNTLENVNEAWGTIFWSQIYTEWEQIQLPKQTVVDAYTGYGHNPGLLMDFARFSSDSLIEFAEQQCMILKKYKSQPIIHNMVSEYCDNYKLVKLLDGAGYDAYPRSEWDHNTPGRAGFYYDLTRGYDRQTPFWILEQQSGPCGWNVVGDTPKRGQLRLWSLQGAARGAEALVYFRWRTCLFGTEQFWYGILNHNGVPGSRYEELKDAAGYIQKFEHVFKRSNEKQVLLVYDYDNKFSHDFQPHIRGFCYREETIRYYEAFQKLHVPIDVGGIATEFTGYRMIVLPFVSMISEEHVKRLEDYVKSGGTVILTPFAGMREENNQITEKILPGVFRRLSGVQTDEFFYAAGQKEQVSASGKNTKRMGSAWGWCEILKPVEAETMAIYEKQSRVRGYDCPAITRHSFGRGCVYYVGSLYEDYTYLLKKISVQEVLKSYKLPLETECISKDEGKYLIILNHGNTVKKIEMKGYQTIDGAELPIFLEQYNSEILVRQIT